jgi:hypothetical protein
MAVCGDQRILSSSGYCGPYTHIRKLKSLRAKINDILHTLKERIRKQTVYTGRLLLQK